MAANFVLVLGVLLCSGAVLTAKGQVVREDIQRLLQVAEDIEENVEDLEDGIDDIGDEIEDMEDEIEDFGEEIEDMKMDVEGVAAELLNLREEVKTVRSVFKTGQQDIEQRMAQLGEECSADSNCSHGLQKDIKEGLATMETAVEGLRGELEDKVDSLKGELHESHLVVKEELAKGLVNITESHLEVRSELESMENDLATEVDGLQGKLDEVQHYTVVLANHTERDLEELHKVLANHTENCLEVKQELASLQRDMNSTLYILQEIKEQLTNMSQENSAVHQRLVPGSCSELLASQSGYYWLKGSPERVYCDMDRQSCGCGNPWGWMRVANIDMTDPNQQCPEGFRLRPGTSKRMCEMTRYSGGCTSIVFPTHSVQYSRVCGRVQAYQYGSPDAFRPYYRHRSRTLDNQYVDGVSVTHSSTPRQHIWTFVAAIVETSDDNTCPCIRTTTPYTGVVPTFIGNDYFCDTGTDHGWQRTLYSDPLWDGEGCGPTSSCCQFNSPPWFCKELPQPTTDDIEVRVCRDQERSDEDIPFDVIEMYVQ